ncbi:MAG: hypothetical protein DWQ07_20945 [Chloroflexi bacterium]|nr:MAG: hypothetical protein DWQ07_20945 [Chloroflexota bacterium]MBL1194553.1 hypothetical protein [Chloroflexota bacterium]NOH11841.1 hypothetical protein [Chloroflexota bacterium]
MAIKLNQLPIVTVWYKPEETIRRVLDGKAFLGTETLLGVYTVVVAIQFPPGITLSEIDQYWWGPLYIMVISLAVASFFTQIEIYGVTAIVQWFGSLMGGVAIWDAIKAVVAWNKFTYIYFYLLWLLIRRLLLPEVFPISLARLNVYAFGLTSVDWLGLLLVVAFIGILIWRFVIYSRMIATAHQINVWRGVALALAPFTMLVVIIGAFILLLTATR